MKKEDSVGFLLKRIHTEQFALFEENFNEDTKVNFNIQIQFKLDRQNKMIGIFTGFTFEQEQKPFLKIEISCHFKIDENSWNNFIEDKKAKIIIPKGFLAHLTMISVGTARGVLFAKTEGSSFSNFIIPAINVVEIIETDAVFSLPK